MIVNKGAVSIVMCLLMELPSLEVSLEAAPVLAKELPAQVWDGGNQLCSEESEIISWS